MDKTVDVTIPFEPEAAVDGEIACENVVKLPYSDAIKGHAICLFLNACRFPAEAGSPGGEHRALAHRYYNYLEKSRH